MVEDRLARLEQAVAELQAENRDLRAKLQALGAMLEQAVPDPIVQAPAQRKLRVVALISALALVPVLAFTVLHMNAMQSTAVTALNAILLYFVGPAAWRLLVEGLIRAVPAVLFGQATRIAVDKWRKGGRAS